jgi:hypothetical protein
VLPIDVLPELRGGLVVLQLRCVQTPQRLV